VGLRLAHTRLLWLTVSLGLTACGRVGLQLLSDELGPDGSVQEPCVGAVCATDSCPNDPNKTGPGVCGCGRSDVADDDADGVPDCNDFCPGAADKLEDGTCGCTAARADRDRDGTQNCLESCPYDGRKLEAEQCGCGVSERDGDGDGAPDCVDECATDANKSRVGSCGCGVSEQDTDLDGIPDCIDRCPGTGAPYTPDQSCGVGFCRSNNVASTCTAGVEQSCSAAAPLSLSDVTCDGIDDDCDGQVDDDFPVTVSSCGIGACARTGMRRCLVGEVVDDCQVGPAGGPDANCNAIDEDCDGTADQDYPSTPTVCGVGMGSCSATGVSSCVGGAVVDSCTPPAVASSVDTTCNNVDDDCDGMVDEDYVSVATMCGVGACGSTGTTTCSKGVVVDSCKAGTTSLTKDTTCNAIDDDCDGSVDEDYTTVPTNCGVGFCASTGQRICSAGATVDSCVPKASRSPTDDAFSPGNGVDDDCDGFVDEDVPPCNTSALTYEAGRYTVAVPGNCRSLSVRLWGGGGASGGPAGRGAGGNGGPGGYSTTTSLVAGTIDLYVGGGGASGCAGAGTNAGSSAYNGGAGGGADGADGVVSGGGSGGAPFAGNAGGRGYYGGGGGGAGRRSGGLGVAGNGAGGGAASVLVVNGARAAVAGGGGGGGGALALHATSSIVSPGGAGGAGCGGNGSVTRAEPPGVGGGGGGGGTCQGTTTTRGTGTAPANAGSIPSGRAAGGVGACSAGGNGYATITFAP
jgi:Putative metal-binding motif